MLSSDFEWTVSRCRADDCKADHHCFVRKDTSLIAVELVGDPGEMITAAVHLKTPMGASRLVIGIFTDLEKAKIESVKTYLNMTSKEENRVVM